MTRQLDFSNKLGVLFVDKSHDQLSTIHSSSEQSHQISVILLLFVDATLKILIFKKPEENELAVEIFRQSNKLSAINAGSIRLVHQSYNFSFHFLARCIEFA
jgi:hypothetical protein